jgi:DNA invertase Pin-like site-specific DNA recombinase
MNVLKPNLKTTVETLLDKGISQREINRKTGINRKTIRRYGQLYHEALSDAPEHSNYPTGEGYRSEI